MIEKVFEEQQLKQRAKRLMAYCVAFAQMAEKDAEKEQKSEGDGE